MKKQPKLTKKSPNTYTHNLSPKFFLLVYVRIYITKILENMPMLQPLTNIKNVKCHMSPTNL